MMCAGNTRVSLDCFFILYFIMLNEKAVGKRLMSKYLEHKNMETEQYSPM